MPFRQNDLPEQLHQHHTGIRALARRPDRASLKQHSPPPPQPTSELKLGLVGLQLQVAVDLRRQLHGREPPGVVH